MIVLIADENYERYVDTSDAVELAKAMQFKADHIKAKAPPELFEAVAKALEKQIPRKPIEKHYEENGERSYVKYSCPYCYNSVSAVTEDEMSYQNRFCHKCGHAIDWSDEDGE